MNAGLIAGLVAANPHTMRETRHRLSVCLQAVQRSCRPHTHYRHLLLLHTHPFNGPFPGLPRSAGTRKVKPIWILLKQETVSGSGISWAICKSAPRSRQITTPAPHHSVFFTGRMPFLSPNQQRQSTEGTFIAITQLEI